MSNGGHSMNDEFMHIHAQYQWHDKAYILANKQALLNLRQAIDDALYNGCGYATAFTGDGEGYDVLVARINDSEKFSQMSLPYTDEEIAGAPVKDSIKPWEQPDIKRAYEKSRGKI